jgi:hypothetical protein
MISANLRKLNNKNEPCKEGELIDSYNLRISCGYINAALSFQPGGKYKEMVVELRKMADILDGLIELKELNARDFSDTKMIPDGYDMITVPELTLSNFETLIEEHNKLVKFVNEMQIRLSTEAEE